MNNSENCSVEARTKCQDLCRLKSEVCRSADFSKLHQELCTESTAEHHWLVPQSLPTRYYLSSVPVHLGYGTVSVQSLSGLLKLILPMEASREERNKKTSQSITVSCILLKVEKVL